MSEYSSKQNYATKPRLLWGIRALKKKDYCWKAMTAPCGGEKTDQLPIFFRLVPALHLLWALQNRRFESDKKPEKLLTSDTRPEPGRGDGLPPTGWPRPAARTHWLGSDQGFAWWWWRWWSWSSIRCPRPGGRPGPPLSPHLRDKKKISAQFLAKKPDSDTSQVVRNTAVLQQQYILHIMDILSAE